MNQKLSIWTLQNMIAEGHTRKPYMNLSVDFRLIKELMHPKKKLNFTIMQWYHVNSNDDQDLSRTHITIANRNNDEFLY